MARYSGSVKLSQVRDGMVRVAVAYTSPAGRLFKQGDKKFTISDSDLAEMGRNLDEREVPIDYEHNTGLAVAPPGFMKAAGWVGGPGRPCLIEPFALRDGAPVRMLWSWARFTPAMAAMLKQREYRYFSLWFKWNDQDEFGQGVGTRLKAGGMTNTPFLEDLPPIDISDADYQQLFGLEARADGRLAAVALSQKGAGLISVPTTAVKGEIWKSIHGQGGAMALLKGSLKRAPDGTHELHGPDGPAFQLDHKELCEYARNNLGMVDGPQVSAKERFAVMARRYASENGVSQDVAVLAVARTEQGKDLWEQARLAELAEAERGRGW